jgi:hypothetical protein
MKSEASMKIATSACCYLLLSGMVWAETVVVYSPPEPKLSSGHVQVAVMFEGRPLKGMRVDVCKGDASKCTGPEFFSASTNDYGTVTPPELAAGDYRVLASPDELATLDDSRAFLWLRVLTGFATPSSFSMDLTEPIRQARQMQDAAIQQAEGLPVRDHLKMFQGTVVDAIGAVLAGAKIRILKSGPESKTFVLGLTADSVGHFSAQLPEGLYLAVFCAHGFGAEAVFFEVTKDGSGELRVGLPPGKSEIITLQQSEPPKQVTPFAGLCG